MNVQIKLELVIINVPARLAAATINAPAKAVVLAAISVPAVIRVRVTRVTGRKAAIKARVATVSRITAAAVIRVRAATVSKITVAVAAAATRVITGSRAASPVTVPVVSANRLPTARILSRILRSRAARKAGRNTTRNMNMRLSRVRMQPGTAVLTVTPII